MQIQWLATALKIKQHLLEKRETLASLKVSHFLPEEWPLTEEKSSISHPLLDINPQKSNFRLLWSLRMVTYSHIVWTNLWHFRKPSLFSMPFQKWLYRRIFCCWVHWISLHFWETFLGALVIEMTTFQANGKEKHGLKTLRGVKVVLLQKKIEIFMTLDIWD